MKSSKTILNDIGIILADTSRSLVYLDTLLKENIFPNFALIIPNLEPKLKSGQQKDMQKSGSQNTKNTLNLDEILNLLQNSKIDHKISSSTNINSDVNINIIKLRHEKTFIYSGYGGVILRSKILSKDKNFLHSHGGYLPDFKGSTNCYYSLLTKNEIGASTLFLNEKIDSGKILLRLISKPPKDRTLIDHYFDSKIRADAIVQTIRKYLANNMQWVPLLEDNSIGTTLYVIHPVLKHIAICNPMETP